MPTRRPITCETRLDSAPDVIAHAVIATGRLHPKVGTLDREALYGEFGPLVRRLIRQYGQDTELRQDLKGEIYYRFCALVDAYDPERGVPLRPYLVRQLTAAVYTYARQHWRLRRRELELEPMENVSLAERPLDPTTDWISDISLQSVAQALPTAINILPERQRKVVIWRYYEERSFNEIAALLGIQPATARSLLRHGLNTLRKHIRQSTPLLD